MNLYIIGTAPVAAVFGAITVWLIEGWLYDLKFYRDNGWNFEIDSKNSGTMSNDDDGPPLSNQARVLFGYPCMVIIFLGFTTGFVVSWFSN